jgi:Mn2+/Fe2+ NRAMP family transporter
VGDGIVAILLASMLAVVVAHRAGRRVPLYYRYVEHRLRLSRVAAAVEGGFLFAVFFVVLGLLRGGSAASVIVSSVVGGFVVVPLYLVLTKRLDGREPDL